MPPHLPGVSYSYISLLLVEYFRYYIRQLVKMTHWQNWGLFNIFFQQVPNFYVKKKKNLHLTISEMFELQYLEVKFVSILLYKWISMNVEYVYLWIIFQNLICIRRMLHTELIWMCILSIDVPALPVLSECCFLLMSVTVTALKFTLLID